MREKLAMKNVASKTDRALRAVAGARVEHQEGGPRRCSKLEKIREHISLKHKQKVGDTT